MLFATAAAGADNGGAATVALDWGAMSISLLGGLALFLFGMEQMAEALKSVAGDRMKLILARLTVNRFMGVLSGAFVTAVVNSSTVTTVLIVGFITAGLMSFAQSIGVIMGANIGSTVTAQIIAFKLDQVALLLIAAGFSLLFLATQDRLKHYGAMVMGLGLIFFGMGVMSEGMQPLRGYEPFLDLMAHMESPWLGILIAAVFTAMIHSSAATTGIVIVMAGQGFITLPAGITLAFGANVGTCATALLAAIGKPREALRAATAHLLFNAFGVLLWVGFIDEVAQVVGWISPSHPELSGTQRLAAEVPRQIANAHTLFNVANTLVFIGFTTQLARLVEWLVPDKPMTEEMPARPRYLDETLIDTPSLALERARMEIGNLGLHLKSMHEKILPAVMAGTAASLKRIRKMDDDVDALHGEIIGYLGRISKRPLTETQTLEFMNLMNAANNLENIGDVIETDMVDLGNKRIAQDVIISKGTQGLLNDLHGTVTTALELALSALADQDVRRAREAIDMKADFYRMTEEAALHGAQRLIAAEPNRLPAYAIEMDIIEKLKRIYYLARRTARLVVPEDTADETAPPLAAP